MRELITLDRDSKPSAVNLDESGFKAKVDTASHYGIRATIGATTGKLYWEATIDNDCHSYSAISLGFVEDSRKNLLEGLVIGSYRIYGSSLVLIYEKGVSIHAIDSLLKSGDILGVSLDLDGKNSSFYINGAKIYQTNFENLSLPIYPLASCYKNGVLINFGKEPFIYMTADLKEQGYLPYDIDNSHIDNLPYERNKYLFKQNDIIYQPTDIGMVSLGNVSVNKELFEEKGTEDISDIIGWNKEIIEVGTKNKEIKKFTDIPNSLKYYKNTQLKGVR